jgi:hypothetical protein
MKEHLLTPLNPKSQIQITETILFGISILGDWNLLKYARIPPSSAGG